MIERHSTPVLLPFALLAGALMAHAQDVGEAYDTTPIEVTPEHAAAVAAQPQRPGRVERHPLAGGRERREPGVQPGRSGKGRSGVRRSTHGALPQTWSSACASRALSCRRSNWLTMSLGAAPRSPACQPTNACSMCAWMRA